MTFGSLVRSCSFWVVLVACSTQTNEPGVKFPPHYVPPTPPHREVTGAAADAVYRALAQALGREPAAGEAFDVPELDCWEAPFPGQARYFCNLSYRLAGGALWMAALSDFDPSTSRASEDLMRALRDAGARVDFQSKAGRVLARRLRSTRDQLTFDDEANIEPPDPNTIEVGGAEAAAVVDALTNAGIKEDDGLLHVLCWRYEEPPSCTYQQRGTLVGQAPKLDAARSRDLWQALAGAARSAGPRPSDPPLDRATFLSARKFTHDGRTLRVALWFSDHPRPTPPAPQPQPAPRK